MKKIFSLAIAIALVGVFSAATFADWTRTTAFVEDTKVQAQGQFQVEVAYGYARETDFPTTYIDKLENSNVMGSVQYGIMDNWNVGLRFGWVKEEINFLVALSLMRAVLPIFGLLPSTLYLTNLTA